MRERCRTKAAPTASINVFIDHVFSPLPVRHSNNYEKNKRNSKRFHLHKEVNQRIVKKKKRKGSRKSSAMFILPLFDIDLMLITLIFLTFFFSVASFECTHSSGSLAIIIFIPRRFVSPQRATTTQANERTNKCTKKSYSEIIM